MRYHIQLEGHTTGQWVECYEPMIPEDMRAPLDVGYEPEEEDEPEELSL